MNTVYLSIGSNLGDKKKNLKAAIDLIRLDDRIRLAGVSNFYKTEPQNFKDQNWFVNAVLKIKTSLEPEPLLSVIHGIEKKLDRDGKPFRFGPRIIDLDIIYYEDRIFKTENLEIPHPRMHERCFVLIPMCDIGAEAIHPVLKLRPDELLKNIENSGAQEVILLEKED